MIKLNWNTRAIDSRLKEAVEEIEVLAFATIDDLRNHVYEDDVIGVLHRLFSELEEVDAKDIPKTNRQPTNKVSDKRLQELIDHADSMVIMHGEDTDDSISFQLVKNWKERSQLYRELQTLRKQNKALRSKLDFVTNDVLDTTQIRYYEEWCKSSCKR